MTTQAEHLSQVSRVTIQEAIREIDRLTAEVDTLREAFCHYHAQGDDLNDTACRTCGMDLRNPIHKTEAVR